MKPKFNLPTTKMCVVVYNDNGSQKEVLVNTPVNNDALFSVMLTHKVGYSQIRAVKSLDATELLGKMGALKPGHRR
jgi:hypothetical protein